jgi:hypothetical protein
VFLIGSVEPLEGMILVAQIGVQLRDEVRRQVSSLHLVLREGDFDSFAQSVWPSSGAVARVQGCRELGRIFVT